MADLFVPILAVTSPKINKTARMGMGKNGQNRNICTLYLFLAQWLAPRTCYAYREDGGSDLTVRVPMIRWGERR